ncbi:MAG: hypothetical protein J0M17_11130 [Planctomycetes bacterium]|nr:hypothetical protein [Planctomycetota bacterium]
MVIPYPKARQKTNRIERQVKGAILGRAQTREMLSHAVRRIEGWLQADHDIAFKDVFVGRLDGETTGPDFLGYRTGFLAFTKENHELVNDILLPKYYDPDVLKIAERFSKLCDVVSIGDLRKRGAIALDTGDEIGRMNYGTGEIPFVRTSDLASWELKREPKQGVNAEVHSLWDQGMQADDILLIRDGTYLVGSSVLLFETDLPLLYCGGIYRIRSLDHGLIPPPLLFALLNLPFARRQMRNKQFTRDIIDTLGRRIDEVMLPIPKNADARRKIWEQFGELIGRRSKLRAELTVLVSQMFAA